MAWVIINTIMMVSKCHLKLFFYVNSYQCTVCFSRVQNKKITGTWCQPFGDKKRQWGSSKIAWLMLKLVLLRRPPHCFSPPPTRAMWKQSEHGSESTNNIQMAPRLSSQPSTKEWQVNKAMSTFSPPSIVFLEHLLQAGPFQEGQSCVRPARTQTNSSIRLGLSKVPHRVWSAPLFQFRKAVAIVFSWSAQRENAHTQKGLVTMDELTVHAGSLLNNRKWKQVKNVKKRTNKI